MIGVGSSRMMGLAAALVGVAIAVAPTDSHADCLDDYVAKNGAAKSIRDLMNDAGFQRCRENPNPGDRKIKLQSALATLPAMPPARTNSTERPNPPPTPPEYITNFYPILRNSFNDIFLFDKRKEISDIQDSEGAQFSFADDRVAQNTTWTAHAMGAIVFQYLHDRYPKDAGFNFIGISVAGDL
jgi:hypothetical protein